MALESGAPKTWLPPRISFGPIPAARYSAITWVEQDRYFYVYGGVMANPAPDERDVIYELDTSASCHSSRRCTSTSRPRLFAPSSLISANFSFS